jgi:uncharacterized protein YjbI with pentapeptide repeats
MNATEVTVSDGESRDTAHQPHLLKDLRNLNVSATDLSDADLNGASLNDEAL